MKLINDHFQNFKRHSTPRALGNGVVPQQGAAAITHLLGRKEAA